MDREDEKGRTPSGMVQSAEFTAKHGIPILTMDEILAFSNAKVALGGDSKVVSGMFARVKLVPVAVITAQQIAAGQHPGRLSMSQIAVDSWMDVNEADVPPNGFVFRIDDDAMAVGPRPIAAGSFVLVDPDEGARPGHIVLARRRNGRPFVRRLQVDGGRRMLAANQAEAESIELTDFYEVIGTVVVSMQSLD